MGREQNEVHETGRKHRQNDEADETDAQSPLPMFLHFFQSQFFWHAMGFSALYVFMEITKEKHR